MQLAVTKAIASGLFGVTPSFDSLLFQDMFQPSDGHESTKEPFPYDIRFLSDQELQKFLTFARTYEQEVWPKERIDAYRGKHLVAKRAAVTTFLWQRYREYPKMTLGILKLWHEVERIEKFLAMPSWFRIQHLHEDRLEDRWNQELGTTRKDLEHQHQMLIQQILAKLT